jgi:hypothetical protein
VQALDHVDGGRVERDDGRALDDDVVDRLRKDAGRGIVKGGVTVKQKTTGRRKGEEAGVECARGERGGGGRGRWRAATGRRASGAWELERGKVVGQSAFERSAHLWLMRVSALSRRGEVIRRCAVDGLESARARFGSNGVWA